jgi:hypothetical protein
MTYKNKLGTMDISHIFLTITLVALAIALLAPLHFNVNKLGNVLTSLYMLKILVITLAMYQQMPR